MEEIVEIFGKRLKIVTDENDSSDFCKKCDFKDRCWNDERDVPICKDAEGKMNRHFEEVND